MPRVLQVISILLVGPLVGMLIAFALAAFALRSDPNIVANGAAPGDGILVILYALISLIISIPLSIWGAAIVWFRPSAEPKRQEANSIQQGVVS